MMPRDTNPQGSIFGGHILSLIDQAGSIPAYAHGGRRLVTVAMREVVFKEPVFVGDVVTCYARVVKVGRTSIRVRVRVVAQAAGGGDSRDVTAAEAVYVNVDSRLKPTPLVSSLPES